MIDPKVLERIAVRLATYVEGVRRSGEDYSFRDVAALAIEQYIELTDWKKDDAHRPSEGEPHFILLARDPEFASLVRQWAERREQAVACGDRPASDGNKVLAAQLIARDGANWRRHNNGKWRK